MRKYIYIIIMCIVSLAASAQERTVQNRPYTDLRPFHFGVVVGTHVQDMEVRMAGPMTITTEDGTQETLVTADQSRWDPGINVGVLGELRLSTHLQLRVAPMMYFGTRHIVFQDLKNLSASGKPEEKRQDMKTAYIAVAGDIIFAAPRFNNHRPYLMAGVSPMINLTGKSTDALKLKRTSLSLEFGVGCDFYLSYFKLRPELKFVYGLGNALDTKHAKELRDKSLLKYTYGVKEARTKMVVLSFYFE
ncbi:porin family protein [uncultured Prevotella sp.]|uniref:type IX secretion/gliding motility protein PorT/SprT n=1 Tax=uncultured Prevotella sp. TaxID=159272 RepID=UPI0027E22B68|nr:porin family protein [uncultured Prevotella sp.]